MDASEPKAGGKRTRKPKRVSEYGVFLREQLKIAGAVRARIESYAERLTKGEEEADLKAKKLVARTVNEWCRDFGVKICTDEHPASPHTVLVINDRGVGRYVLEHRETKRRSHTSSTLKDLIALGIRIRPNPWEKDEPADDV